MPSRIDPVPLARPSFLASPRCTTLDLLDADIAVLAVPFTTPEDLAGSRMPCSPAPAAMREQSLRLAGMVGHYDFDFGGELFADRVVRIVDCGDVAGRPGRFRENSANVTDVIRTVRERTAVPLLLGGDHAATIPALRAFEGEGPQCVVHLGAELDWCDAANGEGEGPSSAMRRASELQWVGGMAQIGLRGTGYATADDVRAARSFGSVLVRAETVHRLGTDSVLDRVPDLPAYYVTLDLAALDPGIAPGVGRPAFGGLTYGEVTEVLIGIAAKGRVVGIDLVGIVPDRDLNDQTSLLGVRLALNLLGAMARAGRLGQPGRADDRGPLVAQASGSLAPAIAGVPVP